MTFRTSRFNVTERKPYFINDGCFGDDAASWFMQELRCRGLETDGSPGQEDFGWYLNFKVAGVKHCLVLGYRLGDQREPGLWIGWLERSRSLLPSLLVGREHGIAPEAVLVVHEVLKSEPTIRDIRWHLRAGFGAGHEELGVPEPQ